MSRPVHELRALVRSATLAAALLVLGVVSAPVAAQSTLERPPNMHGTWVGYTGTVYFNFMHRFADTGAPVRKVLNYPTFLLGTGLGDVALVGLRYATNSELVSSIPNEWELFVRYTPIAQGDGSPLDLSLHAGYNHAARSGDGELTLARTFGERLRLLAAARGFSNALDRDEAGWAWAVGGTFRVSDNVALAGDYAELIDPEPGDEGAWSAGLQLGIPFTPHTFSLQASNATTTTLQGSSVGVSETRYGFEFTVPITLSRYFGSGGGSDGGAGDREAAAGQAPGQRPGQPPGQEPPAAAAGEAVVEVGMTNRLEFTPDTVRIRVGETVRWRNGSDLMHTVTGDPAQARDPSSVRLPEGAATFDSGEMQPGDVFEYTFEVAGEYQYFCIPHEAAGMIAWVIVEES
jgi:plastocyanin